MQIILWFTLFTGPNYFGTRAGAEKILCLEPEIWVPAPQPC